jgi:hypothetical protein
VRHDITGTFSGDSAVGEHEVLVEEASHHRRVLGPSDAERGEVPVAPGDPERARGGTRQQVRVRDRDERVA